jgi:hypothetical protein
VVKTRFSFVCLMNDGGMQAPGTKRKTLWSTSCLVIKGFCADMVDQREKSEEIMITVDWLIREGCFADIMVQREEEEEIRTNPDD